MRPLLIVIQVIKNLLAIVVAGIVYSKLIAKSGINAGSLLAAAIVSTLVLTLFSLLVSGRLMLNATLSMVVNLFVSFIVFTLAGLLIVQNTKPAESRGGYTAAGASADPAYSGSTGANCSNFQSAYAQPDASSEDFAGLSDCLLKVIMPSLKAPVTAVLCPVDEMTITNNNGVYTVVGYVNSQNSYGAFIKTDFEATAARFGDTWAISNVAVGVQTAKRVQKRLPPIILPFCFSLL